MKIKTRGNKSVTRTKYRMFFIIWAVREVMWPARCSLAVISYFWKQADVATLPDLAKGGMCTSPLGQGNRQLKKTSKSSGMGSLCEMLDFFFASAGFFWLTGQIVSQLKTCIREKIAEVAQRKFKWLEALKLGWVAESIETFVFPVTAEGMCHPRDKKILEMCHGLGVCEPTLIWWAFSWGRREVKGPTLQAQLFYVDLPSCLRLSSYKIWVSWHLGTKVNLLRWLTACRVVFPKSPAQ